MKKNMKNIGIMPRLNRIECKCNEILSRLSVRRVDESKMDGLIMKMNMAAKELEGMAKAGKNG